MGFVCHNMMDRLSAMLFVLKNIADERLGDRSDEALGLIAQID